jgi:hypothetical protein
MEAIQQLHRASGFPEVEVNPVTHIEVAAKTIDITFEIVERAQ